MVSCVLETLWYKYTGFLSVTKMFYAKNCENAQILILSCYEDSILYPFLRFNHFLV